MHKNSVISKILSSDVAVYINWCQNLSKLLLITSLMSYNSKPRHNSIIITIKFISDYTVLCYVLYDIIFAFI